MCYSIYNEKDLIIRISVGDTHAFGEVYIHYYNRLYNIALRYIKEPETAEDAIQQVFCKIWEKREKIHTIINLEAFITKSVRNEIINILRRKSVEYQYIYQFITEEKIEKNTPETLLITQSTNAIFSEAITSLPPQQKKIYNLSREQGKSYAEIADQMHISVNTVKWHVSAALRAIRTFLKEHKKELSCITFIVTVYFY